jgi:hypothetical protein
VQAVYVTADRVQQLRQLPEIDIRILLQALQSAGMTFQLLEDF